MTVDHRLDPVISWMRAAIAPPGTAADPLYQWLAYQLGWADDRGHTVGVRAGKGLRPRLCLLACEAVGGQPEDAVPIAAAIELTHEFSLVHDDIEDGDRLRRGRPTLWAVVGQEQAINAGDALWAIARSQIVAAPVAASTKLEIMRRYDHACLRLAEGQHLDLAFELAASVTLPDYIGMVTRKTGALFGAAASLGACAGGGPSKVADALAIYGEAIGVAFQMQDDILGLWGDPRATGKPVGRDLQRRKKSLPVILALESQELAAAIAHLYADEAADDVTAVELANRLAAEGCRDRALAEAHHWREAALAALDGVPLVVGPRAELEALAWRTVERAR
jgi:geranylgeranyl diphosphate synthase, type I